MDSDLAGTRYDRIGHTYTRYRQPDPRIALQIQRALVGAKTVIDVGSGAGSYEPKEHRVVAVEPSITMIRQRAPEAAPVVRAIAEALPFADDSFDAGLAILTIHHWQDIGLGFDELRRVCHRYIFFTWDPAVYREHWLFTDYLPEITEAERHLPAMAEILKRFPRSDIETIPVPWDCTDGFCAAYWRRPEMYLDPAARRAISALAQLDPSIVGSAMNRLARDLRDGTWRRRNAGLLEAESWDCGYRLVISAR